MAAPLTRLQSAGTSTGRMPPAAPAAGAGAAAAQSASSSSSSSAVTARAPPWKRMPSVSSSSASSSIVSPAASSSSSAFSHSSPPPAHRRTTSSSSSSPAAATTPTSKQQPSTPSSSSSSATPASSFEQSLFHRPLTALEQSYVKELTSYSMNRLEREPALLQEREEEIQRAIESLAVKNYRTFVETAEAVHSAHQAVVDMEAQLGMMEEQLPRFSQRCDEFVHKSASTRSAQKLNRCMTEHHSQLLDLLEIPQLMETCVRSALYEEALELYAYAASLSRRHPHIAVMQDVLADMRLIKRSIQSALLALLSGPIQLAQCLKVVSYLRRLDGYDEPTLRQQFLTSRDGFLDGLTAGLISGAPAAASSSSSSSVSASSAALSPYEAVSRYLDCSRVHVFDIVTQYRAIFVDDSSGSEEERSDDGGLLFRWIHHRIAVLLSALAEHLPQVTEGSYLYNLLEQSLYCGSSLSRVGVDFRPLLPPLFSAAILSMFNAALAPACDALLSAMAAHPWYMQRKELTRMGLPMERSSAIMSFPPLTVACNVFIHALNKLRHAALLALAAAVQDSTEATLLALASSLRSYASTDYQPYSITSEEWEGERDAMAVLARGLADELLPAVQGLVRSVYGDALPAEEAGSAGSLQKARAVLSVLYDSDERERRRRADDKRRKEEERRRDEERQKRVTDRQLQDRERDSKRQADEHKQQGQQQQDQQQQQQQQHTEAGETTMTVEADANPEVKQQSEAVEEPPAAIHP